MCFNVRIVDLATGGNLFSRVIPNPPNWNTMKIVLAEIVCAVEILHSVDVLHGDISLKNTVIDSDGHLLLADFGNSEILSRNNFFNPDWKSLSYICDNLFQSDIIVMFRTMTDEQILGKSNIFKNKCNNIDRDRVTIRFTFTFTFTFSLCEF